MATCLAGSCGACLGAGEPRWVSHRRHACLQHTQHTVCSVDAAGMLSAAAGLETTTCRASWHQTTHRAHAHLPARPPCQAALATGHSVRTHHTVGPQPPTWPSLPASRPLLPLARPTTGLPYHLLYLLARQRRCHAYPCAPAQLMIPLHQRPADVPAGQQLCQQQLNLARGVASSGPVGRCCRALQAQHGLVIGAGCRAAAGQGVGSG